MTTTTDDKKQETPEESAADLLLRMLGDIGVGPDNRILFHDGLPHRIGAAVVQEAHELKLQQRPPDAEGQMPFYAVLNEQQTAKIFPEGLDENMCPNGWLILQAVLNSCAMRQQVETPDGEFAAICERIDQEVADQQAAREILPV